MNKTSLLLVSFLGIFLVPIIKLIPFEIYQPLGFSPYVEFIFNVSLFFPFILFFSLLTYKLPSHYWRRWWRFARIAIPVIFALSILINLRLHHTPSGGLMDFDNILDVPAHIVMYSIFVIGSIWQLYKAWRLPQQ